MKKNNLVLLLLLLVIGACKDDDECCTLTEPTLSLSDMTVVEENENKMISFVVKMEGTINTNIVARYSTVEGTAEAGRDFKEIENVDLIFSASQTSHTVEVELIGDLLEEMDETFQVRFFSPSSMAFTEKSITITIENDDDAIGGVVIPTEGYTTPLSYAGMQLVWNDEFQSDALNEDDWTYEIGNGCPDICGWGNGELQFYEKENVYFKDQEYLIIQARPEQAGAYTSSRIKTQEKQTFKYGRIDVRAVLPEGKGLWPAIWMLGENITSVSWPRCGEIDIMELIGSVPGRVHSTVHWGDTYETRDSKGASETLTLGRKFSEKFYVFSLEWKEDEIKFYVDDQLIHEVDPSDMGGQNYPFNQPFFFVFNVAVGGNWPGSPNSTTVFPQQMIVDYVRVFQ